MKFVPSSHIDKPALVQVMVWRQAMTGGIGDPVRWGIYATVEGDELSVRRQTANLCFYSHMCKDICKFPMDHELVPEAAVGHANPYNIAYR